MGCFISLKKCTLENTPEFSLKNSSFKAKVLDCYDGDTITIAFKFENKYYKKKCRIYGIDTPEIRTKNLDEKEAGLQAREFLKNLILNKIVNVKCCQNDDKYGRVLAEIFYEDESIAEIMIQKGYAYRYEGESKKKFEEYKK